MKIAADKTAPDVHPTACVERGAELGSGVRIGPFCHIGPHAVLGDNVELMSHVVIMGDTTIGEGTRVFPHAVLGAEPQNVAYKGERTTLIVGQFNTIREGVTMHAGTANARGETTVGDHCMFLAYSHVAHDCELGSHITFANNVMIGGHTTIGDRVILGGGAAVHQFSRIGHHAFVGGLTGVVGDVIPFGMVVGDRGHLAGLNVVGMKRSGMSRSDIHALRHAFAAVFADNGLSMRENAETVLAAHPDNPSVREMAEFVLSDSKRKFVTPRSGNHRRAEEQDGD